MPARPKTGITPPALRMKSVQEDAAACAVMDRFAADIKRAATFIGENPYDFHSWLMQGVLLDMEQADEQMAKAIEDGELDLAKAFIDAKVEYRKSLTMLNNQRMGYHATMNKPSAHNKGKGNPWMQSVQRERERDDDARA